MFSHSCRPSFISYHLQGVTLLAFMPYHGRPGFYLIIHMLLADRGRSISYRDPRSDRIYIQTVQLLHWSLVRSLKGLVVASSNQNAVLLSIFGHEAFQDCLPRSPRRATGLDIPVTCRSRKKIAEHQTLLRVRCLIT